MGSDEVALVRRVFEMWRTDPSATVRYLDPEIVWDASEMPVGDVAGVYRGHQGLREFWRPWLEAWDELEYDLGDVYEADGAYVAEIRNMRMRGKTSGAPVQGPDWNARVELDDGRFTRVRVEMVPS